MTRLARAARSARGTALTDDVTFTLSLNFIEIIQAQI